MKRIDEFEALRGLMALWVVVGHALYFCLDRAESPLVTLALNNNWAVSVFIMLSGFVIFGLLDTSRQPFAGYLLGRFLRLFPVYLVCLLASAVALEHAHDVLRAAPFETARNQARIGMIEDAWAAPTAHLLAHLTLLHGLVPDGLLRNSDYTLLGQAWSLSVEWQFYLLAPLLLALGRRGAGVGGPVLVLAMTALAFGAQRAGLWSSGFMPTQAHYFAIGIGSYFIWREARRGDPARLARRCWPLALALLPALLLATSVPAIIWMGLFGLVLLRSILPKEPLALRAVLFPLRGEPLRWLGQVSYPVYLSHMLCLYWLAGVLGAPAWPLEVFATVLTVGTVALTLLVSWLLHVYVERPFMALGKRLRRQPGSPSMRGLVRTGQ